MDSETRARASGPDPYLRPVDGLALGFVGVLFLLALVAWGRGIPGAGAGAVRLLGSAALIAALRAARNFRPLRLGELLGAAAPIGMVPVDWALDPVTDLITPGLRDPMLLSADRVLFGETPSLTFQGWLTPSLTEILLLCYLGFFTLLVLPTLLFWLGRKRAELESYVQMVVLFFVTNLAFYLLVPAVGPRFVLEQAYAQPLHGVWVGDAIRDMFRHTPYFRDCFPSGHTAGTLLALAFTWRKLRPYFFAALPVGALCIAATLLCRFHYAIDVLCAVPLTVWAMRGSRALDPGAWAAWMAGLRRLRLARPPLAARQADQLT